MLSKIIEEEDIDTAKRLIYNANHIVVTAHISPDGDAVGSTLGLYHFLTKIGKDAVVILPNRFPAFLNWMPGSDKIVIMEEKTAETVSLMKAADLVFCVDYNSIDRINGLKPLMEQSKAKKIMIDHHPYPGDFCDVTISYPEISSASELVFRFICRMGYFQEITLEGAECIYTGMMTDTGGFTYNSNSAEIYSIIYELINKGIDKDAIYRRVFNTYSADRMKLMGYCLSKMVVMPEEHTAYIVLTQEEKRRFNYKVGDTEGFVNMPLQIEGICKSVFVREDTDKVKLSFRSQGDVPVNTWAAEFGGGGHLNAAGGESYLSLEETIKKLVEIIKRDK
ncbi:MAG: bifunctional oligoribonuclease/PAP phosphatase NrnA [bacterium]|uniref:Bifunctional oligoribonuclease/PAP phosphatase NrnA n=1 Tax=Candidatus Aphodosoma intestinipullorum TaxID=2840674 RepID=A0A940DM66_9BACT|nr:bifunctional oligoribonuclease/PAP phosphatase NrnA [Candidatus Aphodosoma intestinipullorum]